VQFLNYHPFDVLILPTVIFANIDTGLKYAVQYLDWNIFPGFDISSSTVLGAIPSPLSGGLFRCAGTHRLNAGSTGPNTPGNPSGANVNTPISMNYVVPQAGLIVGLKNLLTHATIPNGDYVATLVCLGWTNEWPYGVDDTSSGNTSASVPSYLKQNAFLGFIAGCSYPNIVSMRDEVGSGINSCPQTIPAWGQGIETIFSESDSSTDFGALSALSNNRVDGSRLKSLLSKRQALQFAGSQCEIDAQNALAWCLL